MAGLVASHVLMGKAPNLLHQSVSAGSRTLVRIAAFPDLGDASQSVVFFTHPLLPGTNLDSEVQADFIPQFDYITPVKW
jgi:hypothetical protein